MDGVRSIGVLPVAIPADPAERLAALFDGHYDRLFRLARRMTASGDDALDLVQETFVKAARAPHAIPAGVRAEEAWLVRVLINVRRDQWRKQSVRRRYDDRARDVDRTDDHESAAVARATIWSALDTLTPRRRAIVILHELEEQPIAAIASVLRISAITVRWHLAIAKRDLARVLGRDADGS